MGGGRKNGLRWYIDAFKKTRLRFYALYLVPSTAL